MNDDKTLVRNKPLLFALKDLKSGKTYQINEKATVGRQKGCEIELPDNHISRLHATLMMSGQSLILVDGGSENGSFVNDLRIRETVLKLKDIVRFDTYEFEVITLGQAPKQNLDATLIQTPEKQENQESTLIQTPPEVETAQFQTLSGQEQKKPAPAKPAPKQPIKPVEEEEQSTLVVNQDQQDYEEEEYIQDDPSLLTQLDSAASTHINLDQEAYMGEGDTCLYGYHPLIEDEIYPLNREVILVGKSADADIVINDASVSSQHAEIFWDNGSWAIEDLGSTNGTFLNGIEILEPTTLMPGDFLQFGLIQVVFGQPDPQSYQPHGSGNQTWLIIIGGLALVLAGLGLFLALS